MVGCNYFLLEQMTLELKLEQLNFIQIINLN